MGSFRTTVANYNDHLRETYLFWGSLRRPRSSTSDAPNPWLGRGVGWFISWITQIASALQYYNPIDATALGRFRQAFPGSHPRLARKDGKCIRNRKYCSTSTCLRKSGANPPGWPYRLKGGTPQPDNGFSADGGRLRRRIIPYLPGNQFRGASTHRLAIWAA